MHASLRDHCAAAPTAIRRPAPGTPLHAICEAAGAEPLPNDLDGALDEARKVIDRRTDLPPLATGLAFGIEVMRRANTLLALRQRQQAERNNPDRHEGFAVFFTVYLFLYCGGRFGSGDHTKACKRAAEYLGVAPGDVADAVSHYTAGTCQLIHDDAYGRWGERPAELFSAGLQVMPDLVLTYGHLLDHTQANARLAAEMDADFDARYQPCVEDIEYARD